MQSAVAMAGLDDWRFGGHIKGQGAYGTYPDDSLTGELIGSTSMDANMDTRLKAAFVRDSWNFSVDYQLIARYGDSVELARLLADSDIVPGSIPTDDTRLFDLTHVIAEGDDYALVQRLDRLYVGYSGERWVTRFGRQVLSWGNGLVYQAMDFFNPFDPAAVDKEYKTGDDMLYTQYLRDNGDDLQLVGVVRRGLESGDVEADASTLALKYHGLAGEFEYDALAAYHYADGMLGVGGNRALGGAIWRGDVTLTNTDEDGAVPLVVTSLSYSWIMGGKNTSGVLEYFYNGFGIADGDYSPAALAQNPELLERVVRGELFTLGRNYLVGSMAVEMTPLFNLTPNIFANLNDLSALIQVVGSFDLLQDLQLIAAVNVPAGPPGSEYGGVDAGIQGFYYSAGPSLFAQLAWYF